MDYIDGFLYIEPSLNPWDEVYLILVNDHVDEFLGEVVKYFMEYFCMGIPRGNCSDVLFVGSLCGFGIRVIVAS